MKVRYLVYWNMLHRITSLLAVIANVILINLSISVISLLAFLSFSRNSHQGISLLPGSAFLR